MRCPICSLKNNKNTSTNTKGNSFKKYGSYRRKSDSRVIQRFYCKCCCKTYSLALNDPAYNHKKRRINHPLRQLLSACVSQRRAALILGVSRRTIARKVIYLGALCRDLNQSYWESRAHQINTIQFDELQTIEHSKCKPLSVAVVVSSRDRKIVGIQVSSMPATGHLAAISRKKYGVRPDHRQRGLNRLFTQISGTLTPNPTICSDEHPYYKPIISKHFSRATYRQTKGVRSAVTGQGELKKQKRDPLFYINHTLAMLRANINRLVRKTWCTTKDPARLADHLAIYMWTHNSVLTT